MTLEELERQVLLWNKAAVILPIFFTCLLGIFWLLQLVSIQTLFFIACGLYFTTAIIWWWWTMKSVHLLVTILKNTSTGINEISVELKSIRKEIQADSN